MKENTKARAKTVPRGIKPVENPKEWQNAPTDKSRTPLTWQTPGRRTWLATSPGSALPAQSFTTVWCAIRKGLLLPDKGERLT